MSLSPTSCSLRATGKCENLEVLSLDDNLLTELPPEIGMLSKLEHLSLSGNRLAALPPEIGKLGNLRDLDLTGNQLTALPREFSELPDLNWLHLEGNPWSEPFATLAAKVCGSVNAGPLYAYLGSLPG